MRVPVPLIAGLIAAIAEIALMTLTPTGLADGTAPAFVPASDSPLSVGLDPDGVTRSPNGSLLASADYVGGDISVFTIDPTTRAATPATGSPFTTTKGPDAIAFSPDGSLLAVTSLPSDVVSVYHVDPASGALTAVAGSPFPTGISPRSVAFSSDGKLLAVANSGDGTLSVFAVDPGSGALTPVAGSPVRVGPDPLSVAFSPAGGYLAVGEGGAASVAVFSVAADGTGALTQVPTSPFEVGGTPYGIAYSPDGSMLGVADSTANTLSLFFVDPGTGELSEAPGSPLATGSQPFAVAFSPSGTLVGTANRGSDSTNVFNLDLSTGAATPVPGSPFAAGSEPHALSFGPNNNLAVADGNGSTITVLSPLPPSVTITSPAAGQTFNVGSSVPTTFTCQDSPASLGLASCTDSNGATGESGALDTSVAGPQTYTVTARSRDGQTASATINYTVEALFPEPDGRPTINQPAVPGRVLTCETGNWQYDPTGFAFQWFRNGVRLHDDKNASYTVSDLDEGSSLACAVTASNIYGDGPSAQTTPLPVPLSPRPGCPGVSGALSAGGLGPVQLGTTYAAVRARLHASTRRTAADADVDRFCLTPADLRVGYDPTGRVAWIVSNAPYYTYHDLGVGASLRGAEHKLRGGVSSTRGSEQLYAVRHRRTSVMFGAKQGVINEIGVLEPQLTGTHAGLRSVLGALSANGAWPITGASS